MDTRHFAMSVWVTLALLLPVATDSGAYAAYSPSFAADAPSAANSQRVMVTAHYSIRFSSTREQAANVVRAVESLYAAYMRVLPSPTAHPGKKLSLVLYRDRDEFKRNNKSRPWAEAFYLEPHCYAYVAEGVNPHHWMIHEATHQLAREVSRFKRNQWVEEGLASYFAASKITQDGLRLGDVDVNAYPIWWLPRYRLSGDAVRDAAEQRFIPLAQLLTGRGGPNVDRHFNLYYVHAWSLSHFLFHFQDGKYSGPYKAFLASEGTLEGFAATVGPIEAVQKEWYAYLAAQMRRGY